MDAMTYKNQFVVGVWYVGMNQILVGAFAQYSQKILRFIIMTWWPIKFKS